MRVFKTRLELPSELLVLLTASFMLLFANRSFWGRFSESAGNAAHPALYACVFLLMLALMSGLLALITPSRWSKPILCFFLFLSACCAYFMDRYGAVIDRHALQSVLESDRRESMEWLSPAMLSYFLGLFVLPAVAQIYGTRIAARSWARAAWMRAGLLLACAVVTAAMIGLQFQTLASIARNNPTLRDLINPFNAVNAARGHLRSLRQAAPTTLRIVGADVQRGASWKAVQKPTLLVVVLGESTRAASFGLSGYARATTPELAKQPLLMFSNVQSCGTNTATSVPCLFSNLGRANYDQNIARSQENLLDVFVRAGFAVEWIDNNTGSKHVATRIVETNVAAAKDPVLCSGDSCLDEILLRELEQRLPNITRDTVLVLHLLGSHGPAYFQRYPKRFERFTPACQSVDLHHCSRNELVNAYDNTVAYTDYVVASMIARLASAEPRLSSALFFVSDHGESTGERGFYLHGAPYAIAPDQQNQVPMFLWRSPAFAAQRSLNPECAQAAGKRATSHDAVFPLLLNVMNLTTAAYRASWDPLVDCFSSQ